MNWVVPFFSSRLTEKQIALALLTASTPVVEITLTVTGSHGGAVPWTADRPVVGPFF